MPPSSPSHPPRGAAALALPAPAPTEGCFGIPDWLGTISSGTKKPNHLCIGVQGMSTRVRVWILFLASAIGLIIQIAHELPLPPAAPVATTWARYPIVSA